MIRVMIVDDSPLVRKIAADILNEDPAIEVTATAARAEFALAKIDRERPDVITMDMEMPGMGGLEAIREIMRRRPTPIIVLSAHARRGADLTLQALEAGAVDFILKPSGTLSGGLDAVAKELVEKIKSSSGVALQPIKETSPEGGEQRREPSPAPRPRALRYTPRGNFALVAIGTSTGGPVALKTVLAGLPESFPLPIVVVQHMPPVFTRAFAERLHATCAVQVKEAEDGDAIIPGRVLIAPGDHHMTVQRFAGEPKVFLNQKEPVSGHRPSVDVLMHSVAREYGAAAIGVIMTGMGKDGADGIRELHRGGGYVLAQDKESSVIFGMNREVILNGDADGIMPVDRLAEGLIEQTLSITAV
jgi:two-component system chemotaxis response regulator CheB